MDGKIQIAAMIAHTMPLKGISKGFDLMPRGKGIPNVVAD